MHIATQLLIFSVRDIVEIAVLGIIFYKFSRWLAAHHHARFVMMFHGFFFALAITYVLQMHTLTVAFGMIWPVFCVGMMIIHQKTFLSNRRTNNVVVPATRESSIESSWIAELIRFAYKELQQNRQQIFILMGSEPLDDFVKGGIRLGAPVNESILSLMHASNKLLDNSLVILRHDGTIMDCNAEWTIFAEVHAESDPIHQVLARNRDCLIFILNRQTRLFDVFAHTSTIQGLNGKQLQDTAETFTRKLLAIVLGNAYENQQNKPLAG